VNITGFDAHKQAALPLVGDARVALEDLAGALERYRVDDAYTERVASQRAGWEAEVDRLIRGGISPVGLPSQAEVIGAVAAAAGPRDVVVAAAGSLPGDLHKLWRARDPKGYHLEYGYSCMGYEVAGAVGVKMADPSREVYALVGDGSWLMMSQEIVTAVQEGLKITVVLVDNHGYGSIGALSRSVGSGGFGTALRRRGRGGQISGEVLAIDFVANAESLGARALRATTYDELTAALDEARREPRSTVIVVETDPSRRVEGYESFWDVPVAEVSADESVQAARRRYDEARRRERWLL
jgi:3D-(3,5/4)-trihydroxycyclohexane-1,2-dione acylhydrolase (decyclizing)